MLVEMRLVYLHLILHATCWAATPALLHAKHGACKHAHAGLVALSSAPLHYYLPSLLIISLICGLLGGTEGCAELGGRAGLRSPS